MRSRTVTALGGLFVSLVISVVAWWYFDTVLVFLLVPFVPILFRRGDDHERPPHKECPTCGFNTHEPGIKYCPRDGTKLESE